MCAFNSNFLDTEVTLAQGYFLAPVCFFAVVGDEVLLSWALGGSGFGGGTFFLALFSSFSLDGCFPLKMSSQSGNSLNEGIQGPFVKFGQGPIKIAGNPNWTS